MRKNKIQTNEITNATKTSMKTRVISAIIGVIIVVPAIVLGDWFLAGLIAAVLLIAMFELVRCSGQLKRFYIYLSMVIFGGLLIYWPIFRALIDSVYNGETWKLYSNFDNLYISIVVIIAAAFILFLWVVLHSSFTVRDACFLFTMLIVISLGLQAILYLRFVPMNIHYRNGTPEPEKYFNLFDSLESSLLVLFVVISTAFTDIFAYFVGIFFGRNKMNERVSPKKTWEGFVGGVIISAILCSTIGLLLAYFGHPLLEKVLDLKHWYNIVALSVILPIVSTLGDFVYSSIKRYYEIKDYGKLIPGHGGILDRIDSLSFSAITAAIYIGIASSIVLGNNVLL